MDPNISAQPVQPNLQQRPINEIPQSKNKFKLIILIVILLILVGGVAYYLGSKQNVPSQQKVVAQLSPTPTSDSTANWQTYANDFFGFSLKYPSGWKLSWEDNKPRHILATNEDVHISDIIFVSTDGISLTLGLQENSNFRTNEEYLAFLNNGKAVSKESKDASINLDNKIKVGISTTFGGRNDQSAGYSSGVSFFRDGKTYDISVFNRSSNQEDLLKQILSTFKFTDKNQATGVSADSFIQTYYNAYLICINNHFKNSTGKSPEQDCPYDANIFTSALYLQLRDGLIYAKGDQILCAQNIPQSLTFDKAVFLADGTAVVAVHAIWGSNPPGNINVGLQEINSQWKIASISCDK